MEIKAYKKDFEYSYSLGAFPTIELLRSHKDNVINVYYHSTFDNDIVLNEIRSLVGNDKLIQNDKIINKLSDKGNVFIVGVFNKYESKLTKDENHILLDNPSNMGNLGTIIRSSLGFGIRNLAIIKPGVDYFDPKVIRSSMGSIFNINIEYFNSIDEYKAKYNNHTLYSFMLKAKNTLDKAEFNKIPLTLCFGNEATGLSDSYLDNNSIIIKHDNTIDSLNITNAVSIALYEYYNKVGSKE